MFDERDRDFCKLVLGNDPGASLAAQGAADIFGVGDQGFFAAVFQEPQDGLDLGQHRALGEVAFGHVLLGFGHGHLVQPFLVGLVEVDGHLLHRGGDDKQIGADQVGQHRRTEVLVDHGFNADQIAVSSSITGMPPPPTPMTMKPALTRVLMASASTIFTGRGEATTRRQPRPASSTTAQPSFSCRFLASASLHERADRFGGVLESLVVAVHNRLGHDCRHGFFHAASAEFVI